MYNVYPSWLPQRVQRLPIHLAPSQRHIQPRSTAYSLKQLHAHWHIRMHEIVTCHKTTGSGATPSECANVAECMAELTMITLWRCGRTGSSEVESALRTEAHAGSPSCRWRVFTDDSSESSSCHFFLITSVPSVCKLLWCTFSITITGAMVRSSILTVRRQIHVLVKKKDELGKPVREGS